ncbi:uncharacterized protein LOC105437760 isoform X2 [Strongylocentrotus purpuratus]|uniref:DH domain-containing protein n=1 Tax=Strongylocentrotus purpuratus TaxID=7668 RepID=A0A7M7PT45_STRPU|nr:uncharacterized protein LOC105437760 isoform X2 [Strongylocentrotus purpuratus]
MPSAFTDEFDDRDDITAYDVDLDESYLSSRSSYKMSTSRTEGLRVPSPAFVRADAENHGNLEEQIIELHYLVQEMKEGFVLAMQELSRIQNGDRVLQETLEKHKSDSDAKVEQLTKMVETLQSELGKAVNEVNKNNETTTDLKRQSKELRDQQDIIKNKMEENTDAVNRPSQTHSNKTSQSDESGFHRDVFEDPKDSVPPMLQPFIDSLPEAGDNTVDPDSDSDNSTIQSADQMMKLSRMFAEEYHRHRARLASPATDNLLFNRNSGENEQNSERTIGSNDSDTSRRRRIVESLLSSERTYVSHLRFIQECIIQPLVIESIVPLSDINVMFPPCFGELHHEHSAFLEALETRLSDWKWKGIMGDVLARLSGGDGSSLFQLYTSYVKSFADGLSILAHHLGTSQNFYQFIEKQLVENGKGKIDPITYLMAPLHRIAYYVHSMKRLLKYTAKNHPDRFHVEACLKQLNGLVKDINLLTSQDQPSPTTREAYRSERRNSKASSLSSMETTLRDSGVHSMEGERGMTSISPTEIKQMWGTRQSTCNKRSKGRRKSVTSEALKLNLHEHNDRVGQVAMSFPPNHPNRGPSYNDGAQLSGNTHLVAQYPENSVVPVPGMLGKGINAANFANHDDRQPGDVIDTTRQRRKSRGRRMSLSRLQSFGVYGEEVDTDLENMGYVPSTPANAMPRSFTQNGNSRMRQHRKSVDGMAMGYGHHAISESLLAAHHALLEGHSNLKRMQYRSSDNVPSVTMESMPNFISLADLKRHNFSQGMDVVRPLPQHLRTGTQSRLYARRKSVDVGALQAHIIREEQRAEPPRPRSRRTSHSPRPHSPKAPSPTRRITPPSRSHPIVETQAKNLNGLSEREADAITQQVFVRTCSIAEDDPKDPRQKKGHFKHSLKNIFKRRGPGSRVMELNDNSNKSPLNNNYLSPEPEEGGRTLSPKPSDRSRNSIQRSRTVDLESYVDEDGEPCSAV